MNAPELEALLVEGLYAHRDAQTAQRTAEKGTTDRTNPYITELGKPCDRAVWRNLHGEDGEDFDAAALLQFAGGHAFEELVGEMFGVKGVETLREIRVEIPAEGTIISGRVDFLLLADGHLVELKSIGASALDIMLKDRKHGKPDHVSQLNAYLHATQLGALTYAGVRLVPEDERGDCTNCDSRRCMGCVFREWDHDCADNCSFCCVIPEKKTLLPQHKGFLVYGNIKPDWKAQLSYDRPLYVVEVSYDMLRARREIDRLGVLWAQRTEPEIPVGYSPKQFPCGSRRKDGTIKSWCSHFERCWG